MRRIIQLVIVLSTSVSLFGQEFGGTPPTQRWKQISTDTARIIFPTGLDTTAMRVSSIVHHLAATKPVSLGDKLRKINIVLQHQTTVANGYVGLGPFRSEFFLTPVLNNFQEGSIAWVDQLAIHEYRHVQQFNNFRNGISRTMYYLFGEEGYAVAINAAVPDWFFEGDAVYNETLLTNQGRGKLPLFLNAYPSLWRSGKKYSWMKLRNGSMKDYVPTHYHLGYLMVNYGYEKYGADFWAKVTTDASAYKGLFYPFQKAIKKHAGIDYKQFRRDAFEFYKQTDAAKITSTPGAREITSPTKDYVTNYLFPYSTEDHNLMYLRTSYRHRPAFFIQRGGRTKKIGIRELSMDDQYSYRNGKIVYAAYETDPRWGWRDYSVIRMMDTRTGKRTKITSKSKYFTPDLSPDGSKIATVQIGLDGKSELHILNVSNGELISSIHSSEIMIFSDPKFIDDKTIVTAVRLNDGRMALAQANLENGSTERLTTPSYNVIGYPNVADGIVYFTASYGGNDDIYALRLSDKKISKITNGPLGNYFVSAGNGKINWSTFTADGYQLRQLDQSGWSWNDSLPSVPEQALSKFPVSRPLSTGNILDDESLNRVFAVSDYKKSTRLINIHSWRPYYEDPVFVYSLYGENILNTLQTELYYLYHQDETTHSTGINAVYGGWFPYLQVGTEYTFNRKGLTANRTRQWSQLDSRIGVRVPLSFISGRTIKNFNIGTFYVLRNEFNKGFFKDSIGNTTFSYMTHNLSFTQQVERAVQHIYPKWGYSFSSNYRHALTRYEGYQAIGNLSLYLPGIISNHSLVLQGSFQQRDTSTAIFSNSFAAARGYADYYRTGAGSRMWRLSANYQLPLWVPDFGIGNILYLHRIRANAFYDTQRLYSNDKLISADLRSAGIEFFVDTRWWNQYPLTFGIRISRLLDDDPLAGNPKNSNLVEFILPVSIIPR